MSVQLKGAENVVQVRGACIFVRLRGRKGPGLPEKVPRGPGSGGPAPAQEARKAARAGGSGEAARPPEEGWSRGRGLPGVNQNQDHP